MFSQSSPQQTELQPPFTVLVAPLYMLKGIWLNLTVFFPKVSALAVLLPQRGSVGNNRD